LFIKYITEDKVNKKLSINMVSSENEC